MTVPDLAALLELIAEDERVAQAGFSNQEDPENGWGTADVTVANPTGMRPATVTQHVVTPHVGIIHEEVQRAHIVRWHPGRALAECRAKRRILERHAPRVAVEGPHEGELICGCSNGVDEFHATLWPCADVEDIASVYAARDGGGESTA